jgi:hypothetical protein
MNSLPLEILREAAETEKDDVEFMNNKYCWGGPPPFEEQIAFLNHRHRRTVSLVTYLFEHIAQYEAAIVIGEFAAEIGKAMGE